MDSRSLTEESRRPLIVRRLRKGTSMNTVRIDRPSRYWAWQDGQALAGRCSTKVGTLSLEPFAQGPLATRVSRCRSPELIRDLWDRAAIVITFLANDDALASVCFEDGGVLQSGASDRILIDMSTCRRGSPLRFPRGPRPSRRLPPFTRQRQPAVLSAATSR